MQREKTRVDMMDAAHTLPSGSNCHLARGICQNKKFLFVMGILEKISLVALAAFAAYTSPRLFFPFFGAGIILGAYLHWDRRKDGKKEEHAHGHEEGGGCSQGFLEQLTGVKLPPPLGLAANVAITVCHIDHHDTIFVPLTGLNAGMWVGKYIGEYAPLAYRHAVALITPKLAFSYVYRSSCY